MDQLRKLAASKRTWATVGLLLVMVLVYVVFDARGMLNTLFTGYVEPWLQEHPVLGPVAFMLLYVVIVVLLLPGFIPSLVGGAVFGPIFGLIWVSISATVSSGVAFLLGRYLFKDWVEEKAGKRLNRIQKGIEDQGWKFVAFTRLVPVFPYSLQNYVYGVTRISFWNYFFTSWWSMLPGTALVVYFGWAGRELAVSQQESMERYFFLIASLVGLFFLFSLIRNWPDMEMEDQAEEETE